MGIAENIESIRERIDKSASRAGRNAEEVKLLAVTKEVDAARIIEAARCGVDNYGENYAQELRDKHDVLEKALGKKVKWHFIGRLQRNKVKYILGKAELIHSLDSLSVADEINKRAEKFGIRVPILLEVNIGEEGAKGGVRPEQVEGFLVELQRFHHIAAEGFMTMPPLLDKPDMARPYFIQLRKLRDKLDSRFPNLKELSMGMSGDFEIAIEEGATIVRIGTAIFGPRS